MSGAMIAGSVRLRGEPASFVSEPFPRPASRALLTAELVADDSVSLSVELHHRERGSKTWTCAGQLGAAMGSGTGMREIGDLKPECRYAFAFAGLSSGEEQMAGELVPLVLIPRYSTLVGAQSFTTVGMEVSDYSKAIVNVWRGNLIGTSPTFGVVFEESVDQNNWTTCAGGSGGDPGADTEAQFSPTLSKRWFRINTTLAGTDPAGSCWAIGFLEMREN